MTIDHVLTLDVVLSDASQATFGPLTAAELASHAAAPTLEGTICRELPRLTERHREAIATGFPRFWRQSGGYRLDRLTGVVHGDGLARSEFNRRVFGDELYTAMQETKRLFDPHNRMNPGKIVDAPAMTDHLRDAAQPPRLELTTRLRFDAPGGMRGAADRCMNIGLCRKASTGVM